MEIYKELLVPVQEYLKNNGFIFPDWFISIMLLILISALIWTLNLIKKRLFMFYKYKKNSQDLHPFYTKADIKRAKQYFIPTRLRDKSPSNFDDLMMTRAIDIDTDAIEWFMERAFDDKDDARFYLILADSGMGKTTLLINLYLRYSGQLFRKYNIKLFPIGHPQTLLDIDKLKQQGLDKNTILLLDAFDEDNKALQNWKERFDEIISFVQGFREVVITSRTQFFPSEIEEPYETSIPKPGGDDGFHLINKMYVSPFSESDVSLYLDKKFGRYNPFSRAKKIRAKDIVKQSPSLMLRPMLLAYIDDLLESTTKYKYVFQIYEELVLKWISREANRVESDRKEEFRENLFNFSTIVAVEIYKNWTSGRKGLILSKEEIDLIAKNNEIHLHSLEMKSKSLLNRNVIGEYKFSHKSILEFLLAKECMISDRFGENFNFTGFDQAQRFVAELSKVKYVLQFLNINNIQVYTKYYDIIIVDSNAKVKKFLKTFVVNRNQFTNLLLRLDDNRFVEGFNDMLFQNIIILEDSQHYKLKNIGKIKTLKRVTIYTNFRSVQNGTINNNLKSILPNCYIPRW